MTEFDYQDLLIKLLPPGRAWSRDHGGTLGRLLLAIGDTAVRVEERRRQMIKEADPRTAEETLGDWEAMVGLPDACTGLATGEAARRAAIWQKLTGTGGQSVPYLVAAAARLGYTIEIEEFRPCYCDCDCDAEMFDEAWHATWLVQAEEEGPAPVMECVFARSRPAHTTVIFQYGFVPDAMAVFAAMTTPPSLARKTLINTVIKALIEGGYWPYIGMLYFMAAHDSQAATINWKNPSGIKLLPVNSPVHTVDVGYAGDAVSAWVNTQIANNNAAPYSATSAMMAVRMLKGAGAGTGSGLDAGAQTERRIRTRPTGFSNLGRLNESSAGIAAVGINDLPNVGMIIRQGTDQRQYDNGVQFASNTVTTSTALSATPFSILTNGAGTYSDRVATFYATGNLPFDKAAGFSDIVNSYFGGL